MTAGKEKLFCIMKNIIGFWVSKKLPLCTVHQPQKAPVLKVCVTVGTYHYDSAPVN